MTLNAGDTLLNGQYHIVGLLGRGGFGYVYQARDTQIGEDVAIKELIPTLVGDEAMLKRFLYEAKMTLRLTHPQIVRTHHVFADRGNYYIVMECMSGGSLESYLSSYPSMPVDMALRIAGEICAGLSYAHARGVVHCDLKPANILLTAEGEAKVADFGIAYASTQMLTRTWMTSSGFVAGTPRYMSPEQVDGVRDDPRVDIYALGAMLYRMIAGRPYLDFDERDTPGASADNIQRIRTARPAAPSAYNPQVPAWLDAVILKALAKQPGERYASADELRAAMVQRRAPMPTPAPVRSRPDPRSTIIMPPTPSAAARPPASLPVWVWPAIAAMAILALGLLAIVLLSLPGRDGDRAASLDEEFAALTVALDATETLIPTAFDDATVVSISPSLAVPTQPDEETPFVTEPPPATEEVMPIFEEPTSPPPASDQALIPAGVFFQGSSEADVEWVRSNLCAGYKETWCTNSGFENELPQQEIYLDAFVIDRYEVTNAEYRQCVDAGACAWPQTEGVNPRRRYFADPAHADYPVVYVTWYDADNYCRWIGGRLPTAWEWEKAARGEDGRWWPWGNWVPDGEANFRQPGEATAYEEHDRLTGGDLAPGDRYPGDRSVYGVMNMAGNVMEWVGSLYKDTNKYEIRGGSWNTGSYSLRAASRASRMPDKFYYDLGFRCAADARP